MKITYKINVYNLLTYLLVFAIIKPYFLPVGLRQASKIIILISVFLFTISREKKERIVNLSWLFSGCVLLSAVMAYLKGGYQDKDFWTHFSMPLHFMIFIRLLDFASKRIDLTRQ
jgi:hypothetical protein